MINAIIFKKLERPLWFHCYSEKIMKTIKFQILERQFPF